MQTPFSRLSDQQILALPREMARIGAVPGVITFWVDLVGPWRNETAIIVHVDDRDRRRIAQLPVDVEGVPVIARLEDRSTGKVIETIDPREHGGGWPLGEDGRSQR